MSIVVTGVCEKVTVSPYTTKEGEASTLFRATLADPGTDYKHNVSGPAEFAPTKGETVAYRVMVRAQKGQPFPWVSIWALDRAPVDALV